MCAAAKSSQIFCSSAALSDVEADLALLPWFEREPPAAVPELDAATAGEIARALSSGEFAAKPFELFPIALAPVVAGGRFKPQRILLIGAGPRESFGPALVRRLAAAASIQARQRRASRAAFVLRSGPDASSETLAIMAQAAAEGLTLGEFSIGSYKTMDPAPPPVPAWTLVLPAGSESLDTRVARGRVLGECSNLARQLTNEPGNVLVPSEFAVRAAALAREGGVKVDILDEAQITALGMGLLLGVARGSVEPPRLVAFHHDPPGAPDGPILGLVGKGITFDTGGISIKPADGMERMKDDMAGGAAVTCAMRAIGALGAPIRVVGVVAMAENMPGSRAVKPGDILRSAEGKTVEVINTDAEGRLVLCDVLHYVNTRYQPKFMVNLATLTGAIIVALGQEYAGLFSNDDRLCERLTKAGQATGERVWRMPLGPEYDKMIDSKFADMKNTGGRFGGSITAAQFIQRFVGKTPWAHLDIAGTGFASPASDINKSWGSGWGVQLLDRLVAEHYE
jgi:leucyl aminopeptidase